MAIIQLVAITQDPESLQLRYRRILPGAGAGK
jgi:hypothetical protein